MVRQILDFKISTAGIAVLTDNWVFGDEVVSENEYIIHTAHPRFAAKFLEGSFNEVTPQRNSMVFDIGGYVFYDIDWFDNEPDCGLQVALLVEAAIAIDCYSV